MATKKLKNPKNGKAGGALVSMADIEKMYAVEAVEAAAAAPIAGGVPLISLKSEMFSVGEIALPDPLHLIVLAEAHQNTWYDTPYDPENPSSPACFAQAPVLRKAMDGSLVAGTGESAMVAHETSPNRQGGVDFKCQGCEMNAFGSAEVGKGKACQNTRVLAVCKPDDPSFGDNSPLQWAKMILSPTALEAWGKFVMGLERAEKRPPHGVIIKFSFDKRNPDERKRKRVIPIGYSLIADASIATKVNALRREILESGVLQRPLPVDSYQAPGAKKKPITAKGKGAKAAGRVKGTPVGAAKAKVKPRGSSARV